jgi:FkbM family methyltransferase
MGLDVISYDTLKQRYKGCNLMLTIGTPDVKELKERLQSDGFLNIFAFDMLLFDFYNGSDFIFENMGRFERLYALLEDDMSRRVLIARLNYILASDKAELERVRTANEYFDMSVFSFTEQEYFVDAGALDGQTALAFANVVPDYKAIACFEPDARNYSRTLRNTASLPRITVYPLGLWSGRAELGFESVGGASCITEAGEECIQTAALDEILAGEPVTFIKMDIEGAETEAIKGAGNTIVSRKPKLAVCVYHRQEDILTIPFKLKELVPEYGIYLRHHSASLLDTVCYAAIKENA